MSSNKMDKQNIIEMPRSTVTNQVWKVSTIIVFVML